MVPRGRLGNGSIDYLSLTFDELSSEQDAWIHLFRRRDIAQGSRVLLMVKPGLPLIAITFALFKMGAVPVVIDPGMGLRNFLSCVRRSKPDHLVGISLAVWISRIFRGSFSSLSSRIKVGGALARQAGSSSSSPAASAKTRKEDLAAILFTSGSTGPPKGVCYEHGMFEGQVEAIRTTYEIEPGEIDLPMLPVFALFNPALGMTTVVPEINPSKPATVDPAKIVQAIQQCSITNSFGSPTLWKKIGRYCESSGISLPSLKRVLMAGAPVPPDLMACFKKVIPNGQTHSPYGATEVLPVSTVSDEEVLGSTAEKSQEGKGTCVGLPIVGSRIKILPITDEPLDTDDLHRELPSGEIGEIVVTGPTVTKEYDQLPEATRGAKIIDGNTVWHRMGDLGYRDSGGRIWFCGRKVERVITRNGIYYTDCCEGVFNQHPKVFRAALIGRDTGEDTEPVMVIEPFPEHFPKGEKAKLAFCDELQQLALSSDVTKSISKFHFEKALPVDVRHNAKIHRLALARKLAVQFSK